MRFFTFKSTFRTVLDLQKTEKIVQFPYISYISIFFSEINEFITAQQEAWTSAYLYLIFLHEDFLFWNILISK